MAVQSFGNAPHTEERTGSIYLHCDSDGMSHYLKELMMDSIFRLQKEFSVMILSGGDTEGAIPIPVQASQEMGQKQRQHSVLYVKSKSTAVLPYKPLSEKEAMEKFVHRDEKGRYFTKGADTISPTLAGCKTQSSSYEWMGDFQYKHPAGWCSE